MRVSLENLTFTTFFKSFINTVSFSNNDVNIDSVG